MRAEQTRVVVFGSDYAGPRHRKAGYFCFNAGAGAKLICLGDYAIPQGASEMGIFIPTFMPGYVFFKFYDDATHKFKHEWEVMPNLEKGLELT